MDWKILIQDLAKAGLRQEEIATRCGCRQPSISDLATGRTTHPNYQIADALRELHAEVMARKAGEGSSEAESPAAGESSNV